MALAEPPPAVHVVFEQERFRQDGGQARHKGPVAPNELSRSVSAQTAGRMGMGDCFVPRATL